MIRRLLAAAVICCVIVFFFFQFYHFLKRRVVMSDLKAVTEKRIGAFLKAPVHVDRISIGLLKHISLSGLKITHTSKGYPLLLGAKKIIVRYDLLSFIKRNFRIPAEIFLDAPRLTFRAFQSPGTLFDLALLKSDRGILTRFEFEEGEIQLPWIGHKQLHLTKIEGLATPKKGNVFDLRFKSRLVDAASGSLLAYGEIDPNQKTYHLEITLDEVSFSQAGQVPISGLKGTVELENDMIRIRKVEFLFRGVPCELSGEVRDVFSPKPLFAVSILIKEGKLPVRLDLQADFKMETVGGRIRFADRQFQFKGSLVGEPVAFQIPSLNVNDLYQASAQFDIEKGIYRFKAEREGERFRLDFSMADFSC